VKELLLPVRPSWPRVLTAGLVASVVAVGLARLLGAHNLAAATSLCLLGVVVASAIAGRRSGLLAAVISFLGLNFFFTEPRHTLAVNEVADLVALVVFLIAAVIVGTLLSRAIEERDRAERRATEAQVLSETTTRLSSNEPFEQVLEDLAEALSVLFGLAHCEIETQTGRGLYGSSSLQRPSVRVPLATESTSVGSLTATRGAENDLFSTSEVELLGSIASQIALAVRRVMLDREVQRARLEAETSSLRAALFSSVTHDLKTPLASIKASATGLIAEGTEYTDAQREEMARTVIEEADHLNQIVGNLLELARMRAGALVPAKQIVFFEDIVASALRRMSRSVEDYDVRSHLRADLPPIEVDPVQVEQAFTNVLENAMRFSPKGSEIQITAARWQDVIQARVSDHGPGIPETDRKRVFEEFFSQGAGTVRAGTGLGLAIARAVVLAHNGGSGPSPRREGERLSASSSRSLRTPPMSSRLQPRSMSSCDDDPGGRR
jgi:two-component system, OmpR family, sensor histidine kinase KdpD